MILARRISESPKNFLRKICLTREQLLVVIFLNVDSRHEKNFAREFFDGVFGRKIPSKPVSVRDNKRFFSKRSGEKIARSLIVAASTSKCSTWNNLYRQFTRDGNFSAFTGKKSHEILAEKRGKFSRKKSRRKNSHGKLAEKNKGSDRKPRTGFRRSLFRFLPYIVPRKNFHRQFSADYFSR